MSSVTDREAQLHILALCAIPDVSWYVVARAAQEPDGLDRLLRAEQTEVSTEGKATLKALKAGIGELKAHLARARDEVAAAEEKVGARLVTVLDDEFPANLRLIFNLPPFLFHRGALQRDDARSVAVAGTRNASDAGLKRARARWPAPSSPMVSPSSPASRPASIPPPTRRRSTPESSAPRRSRRPVASQNAA